MDNEFNEPPVSFKPASAPITPYQKAAEDWDKRIGDARVQAKNWRIFALCLCGINAVLVCGLIYQSGKSTVTPYVVQVEKSGVVQAVGPAVKANFTPDRRVIEYFLSQFVQQVRAVPTDPVVARNQWLVAYAFLRQSAANTLNEIAVKEQPLNKVGLEAVSVQIRNIVPVSKDSYQLRWEETTFNKEGITIGSKNMTGIFTVEISPPSDESKLKVNPLGLFIKQFSWSRDV
jgi:type IV secretory pathway TrbF-like protein